MEIIDRENETNLVEQEAIANISEIKFDNQASENDGTRNKLKTIDEVSEDKYQIDTNEQENQEITNVATHNLEDYYTFVGNTKIVEKEIKEVGSKEVQTIQHDESDTSDSKNANKKLQGKLPYECKTC